MTEFIQIFTSEEVELPRGLVADFLEKLDPAICARYVEFLIAERTEESTVFHNRLAELYLNMTLAAKKHGDSGMPSINPAEICTEGYILRQKLGMS